MTTTAKQHHSLAIIPARGGSKRIPFKNIKLFLGNPIIDYPIRAALASNCFDEVMVSTDTNEIALVAKQSGAVVPFMRSSDTSSDTSTTIDVLCEVIEKYKSLGQTFEYVCCIYPTAVFATPQIIQAASEIISKAEIDELVTVAPYNHPIERALQMDNSSSWLVFRAPNFQMQRTQELPTSYYDAGQLYFFKTSAFEKEKRMFLQKTKPIILNSNEVHDIDAQDDWALAELKYQHLHKESK